MDAVHVVMHTHLHVQFSLFYFHSRDEYYIVCSRGVSLKTDAERLRAVVEMGGCASSHNGSVLHEEVMWWQLTAKMQKLRERIPGV